MRARVLLAVLILAGATGLTRAQDKPLERPDLDKRVVGAVYETAVIGTDIFNNKSDYGGCYRLYQGALIGLVPMLDHRPKLQATVKERLKRAGQMKAADAAFELRTALDEIQNEIAPPAKVGMGKTLWDRLGGEAAVKAVVKDFVKVVIDDPKVNFFRGKKFDLATLTALEKSLVEYVSSKTGGPLKYTGKDMKAAHKGMGITDAEFDASAADLITVLKKYKVPQPEMDELMKIVGGTRGDIVEKVPAKPPEKAMVKTLWERLGGEPAVKVVVHDFVTTAGDDKKVNFFRGGKYPSDAKAVAHLEKMLVELISQTTGGPLKYTGKSMTEAHKGMGITDAEFDALAGDLVATLKKHKVGQTEIDELVKIVGSTRTDIVEKK